MWGCGVAAGSIDVSSDGTSSIEVSCRESGSMGGPGGRVLAIQNTEVSIAPVAFGAGTRCEGVGTTSLNIAGSFTVFMGAEANVTSNTFANGGYDTSLGGGSPITIDIVYQ